MPFVRSESTASQLRVLLCGHVPRVAQTKGTPLHRSNAQELISKVPVIVVDGTTAVCDGGEFGGVSNGSLPAWYFFFSLAPLDAHLGSPM